MKECFKCHAVKPLSEFYKHAQMSDGHLNKCKECTKRDVSENYSRNRDRYCEYERHRAMLPHRVQARKEYASTERGREAKYQCDLRWRRSDHGRMVIAEHVKRYRAENPEKARAHRAVNNAVREGRLIKKPCEVCGSAKSEGHHPDYSKPLDVRWLCSLHHKAAHKNRPQEEVNYVAS